MDGCIAKPLEPSELVEQVEAALRRPGRAAGSADTAPILVSGSLELDMLNLRVRTPSGEIAHLIPTEPPASCAS